MNGRILALVMSLIVSGCAGLYANNAAGTPSASASQGTTVSETASEQDAAPASSAAAKSSSRNAGTVKQINAAVPKTASSCPKSASSKDPAASSDPLACAQKNTCAQNSGCADSGKDCAQNACQPSGKTCTNALNCGGTGAGQSLNDYINSLLNGKKNCSRPSGGSASKPASSAPVSSTPASSGSTGTGTYASFQNQVIQLVNQERTSRGLKALAADSALNNTATLKSQDMAKLGYFDHTSPTYGSPFDLMSRYGISYRAAGENIAMGQTSPQQVMQGWMNSAGHRANILSASYTKIGVGIAQNSSGRYYWTQHFIG